MRKSPMNYLVTMALAAVLWVGTGIFLGNYLGDRVSLETATTDTFLLVYRVVLVTVAALGFLNCCYWYFYGAKPSTGANIRAARRVWRLSFVAQVAVAAAAVIAMVLAFSTEHFASAEYLLVFGAASVQAWLFFWVCTFFMSPRSVVHVPFGKG